MLGTSFVGWLLTLHELLALFHKVLKRVVLWRRLGLEQCFLDGILARREIPKHEKLSGFGPLWRLPRF